jgi:hypothetical protein
LVQGTLSGLAGTEIGPKSKSQGMTLSPDDPLAKAGKKATAGKKFGCELIGRREHSARRGH